MCAAGLLQRVAAAGSTRLLLTTVNSLDGPTTERLRQWRQTAEQTWHTPGHGGWSLVQEPLVRPRTPWEHEPIQLDSPRT